MFFKKAKKQKRKSRIALFGASGDGKTYSALAIATGMAKAIEKREGRTARIAFVDTENDTALIYADKFDFEHGSLGDKSPDGYVKAVGFAESEGFDIVIVDSLTHAWKELLSIVDRQRGAHGMSGWVVGNQKQEKLIDKILNCKCHLICTMRSATEWAFTQNDKGKMVPERLGLKPQQGKDIEFEFDLLMLMDRQHRGTVLKDRTGHLQDRVIENPGEEMGAWLIDWLSEGDDRVDDVPIERQRVVDEDAPAKMTPMASAATARAKVRSSKAASATALLIEYMNVLDTCESLDDVETTVSAWSEKIEKMKKAKAHADAYVQHTMARVDESVGVDADNTALVVALLEMREDA